MLFVQGRLKLTDESSMVPLVKRCRIIKQHGTLLDLVTTFRAFQSKTITQLEICGILYTPAIRLSDCILWRENCQIFVRHSEFTGVGQNVLGSLYSPMKAIEYALPPVQPTVVRPVNTTVETGRPKKLRKPVCICV